MLPFGLLIAALATWRIARLLLDEEGPWGLFARARYYLGVRYDANSRPYGKNVIAELFVCFWCLSLWIAAAVVLVFYTRSMMSIIDILSAMTIIDILAVSALAIVIEEIVERVNT